MNINKKQKDKIRKTIDNAGKVALGFCAGAVVVGVTAAIKMNRNNRLIAEVDNDCQVIRVGFEHLKSKVKNLQHEIDIRDCMIMEGIDGDTDIYARRMEHFRDYKIQTTDIAQDDTICRDYCAESALDAEVTYREYLGELDAFESDIPVIEDDEELPF